MSGLKPCVGFVVFLFALTLPSGAGSASVARHGISAGDRPPVGGRAATAKRLILVDSFGFRPEFVADIESEVSRILRRLGVETRWLDPASADRRGDADRDVFRVMLSGKPPVEWGVKRRAMGILVPTAHPRRRVVVFPQRVLNVLDLDHPVGLAPTSFDQPRIARALARVVAHELVHALAPEHSHAEQGLMRGTLNRRFLLAAELPLDPACREALARALRSTETL